METCDHGLEHQADVRPSPPTVRWKQSFSRAIGRAEVENSPRGDGWDGLNHTPLSIALVSAIHAPHRQPDKTRVRQAARAFSDRRESALADLDSQAFTYKRVSSHDGFAGTACLALIPLIYESVSSTQ